MREEIDREGRDWIIKLGPRRRQADGHWTRIEQDLIRQRGDGVVEGKALNYASNTQNKPLNTMINENVKDKE